VQQKKQKKMKSVLEKPTNKSLSVRYAEVLKLREAVAQTQANLNSVERDRTAQAK
jgi:hypothetical protein